jgi:outer membrane protein OmpA-like peptidoglycan-associated protein
MQYSKYLGRAILPFTFGSMFLVSGCLATRDWVQTWVPEQLFPIEKRVADNEAGLTKVDGRVSTVDARVDTMAKQIADLETRLGQTNAKADLALESLQRLKPERKMVLNFTDGAYFASNSIQFSGQAKKDVDSFLSDLKGQSDDGSNLMFVVAGYTDSVGSPSYNYDLSKRRAESIAAYLVANKNIDPTRVMAVGYGERTPVGDKYILDAMLVSGAGVGGEMSGHVFGQGRGREHENRKRPQANSNRTIIIR